ncbi:MAG: T9SS type A sorting domain-containing protein [Algibacter sp.]|uniref:T9SS type A sorting domain-containing protein n=1 Tax=Algibacter sp. TaxID=1872428 RepID=UPI003296C7EE
MFKKLFLFLFFCSSTFAQDLYVDDNTAIFAKDVVVFVTDDIKLETANSNLYFRGNAQLVQDTNNPNSGLGKLSIYQNQTTGVYEYNYFCSPVGVSDTSINNNVNFNGSNIHDPADETVLENVTSTPYAFTTAYEATATELSKVWLYTLRDGEGYWSWKQILDTGNAETGYGFTLKGSPNPNNVLDFRGRPNNGTITVSCDFDGNDDQASGAPGTVVTLTGNPYPSALDLKLFFVNSPTNRANLTNQIFFWEQEITNTHYLADYEGGYGTYTPGDLSDLADNGTYVKATFKTYNVNDGSDNTTTKISTIDYGSNNARRYAAVGQGFLIQSDPTSGGGNVTFDNSMRIYFPEDSNTSGNGAVFYKNSIKKNKSSSQVIPISHNGVDYKSIFENPTIIPEIKLHSFINNTFYKENIIAFRAGTPNNNVFNKFFDGENINTLADDAYLISSEKELVIKSINYNENTRLALGLKASQNNTIFNITIHELKDVPEDVTIFIYDNETKTYTNIVKDTFNVNLNKGVYNHRFEVTFTKTNTVLSTSKQRLNEFKVSQNNNISKLSVLNPTSLNMHSFSLYDVSGKQVIHHIISSNISEISYSTKGLSNGVYVVKIDLLGNQIISKRIVVNNRN